MAFINAFLGLCSAVGTGTATEMAAVRQPISFNSPRNGVSVSSRAYSFGTLPAGGAMAGRAIFDSPTGGNLLLVMPFATPRPVPLGGPTDQADAGWITLQFTGLAAFPDGDAFSGTLAAGTVVGTCYDELAVVSRNCVVNPATGGYQLVANLTPLSTGVGLTIVRGVLRAT
ncbi:MAG: hypothetical protein RQ966_16945 [Acetobacteraceae bacterium]|nr:hypothetical protein [Acetobacteraceae bacterium]